MELGQRTKQLLLDYERVMDEKYHFKETLQKMRDRNAGNRARHSDNDVKHKV